MQAGATSPELWTIINQKEKEQRLDLHKRTGFYPTKISSFKNWLIPLNPFQRGEMHTRRAINSLLHPSLSTQKITPLCSRWDNHELQEFFSQCGASPANRYRCDPCARGSFPHAHPREQQLLSHQPSPKLSQQAAACRAKEKVLHTPSEQGGTKSPSGQGQQWLCACSQLHSPCRRWGGCFVWYPKHSWEVAISVKELP